MTDIENIERLAGQDPIVTDLTKDVSDSINLLFAHLWLKAEKGNLQAEILTEMQKCNTDFEKAIRTLAKGGDKWAKP